MIEPKIFYRKMEALLAEIGEARNIDTLLPTILRALEATFGAELYFQNGHLYVEAEDAFVLHTPEYANRLADHLPLHTTAVQLILRHGSYIFNDPSAATGLVEPGDTDLTTPVAFAVVRGPRRRWLFVYQLVSGWDSEEITCCMSAVRSSLNYKLHRESIEGELEQAAQVQWSLLPSTLPTLAGFEFAVRMDSADEVGGDWYDFLPLDEAMLGVSIGDASGHGLSAALLVRDVITGLRMGVASQLRMLHILRTLNQVIHRSAYSSRFVSLFYGELEPSGNFIYANAGHPPPLLVLGGNVQELEATGMILGPLLEIGLDRAYVEVQPGAVLVFYTDGIVERSDRQGDLFGSERLARLVVAHQDQSAQALVDVIFETVISFGQEDAWEDDATVLVIKRAT